MTIRINKSRFFPIRNMVLMTIICWISFFLLFEPNPSVSNELFQNAGVAGIINILLVFYFWIDWKMESYTISSDRLTHSYGVFLRSKDFHTLENITTIAVKQTLIGMLFGYGNIRLYSPFTEEPFRIKKIPHPFQTAEHIERILPGNIPITSISPRLSNRNKTLQKD